MRTHPEASNPALTEIAERRASEAFVEGYEADESEGLGLAIASHFRWDGLAILETMHAALEDANYHTEAGTVSDWIEAEKSA